MQNLEKMTDRQIFHQICEKVDIIKQEVGSYEMELLDDIMVFVNELMIRIEKKDSK